jgi:hypothetical protein
MQKTLLRLTLTRFKLYAERTWLLFCDAWYKSEIERLDRLIAKYERVVTDYSSTNG